MKTIKNILPLVAALIPQVVFASYTYIMLATIAIGFLGAWFSEDKGVFRKMFLFQLVFFTILYFVTKGNIFYLDSVVKNLGLPTFLIPFLFILFNTLNISFLFYFGNRLHQLLFNKVG